jgi:hypothetical protein
MNWKQTGTQLQNRSLGISEATVHYPLKQASRLHQSFLLSTKFIAGYFDSGDSALFTNYLAFDEQHDGSFARQRNGPANIQVYHLTHVKGLVSPERNPPATHVDHFTSSGTGDQTSLYRFKVQAQTNGESLP